MVAVDDGGAGRIAELVGLLFFAQAHDFAAFGSAVFDQALTQPLALGAVDRHEVAALEIALDRRETCREQAGAIGEGGGAPGVDGQHACRGKPAGQPRLACALLALCGEERAGICLAIINGTHDAPIGRALDSGTGTLFTAQGEESARKAWLSGRLAPAGVLTVDPGCTAALANGASLLAAGLTAVEGDFQRGDLVAIHGAKGERLGQGLVEYSAAECRQIVGLREEEQADKLGYAPRAAVLHRDHMVRA